MWIVCVASVSVGFGSNERPRNGIFCILPARKIGRSIYRPVVLGSRTAQKRLLSRVNGDNFRIFMLCYFILVIFFFCFFSEMLFQHGLLVQVGYMYLRLQVIPSTFS